MPRIAPCAPLICLCLASPPAALATSSLDEDLAAAAVIERAGAEGPLRGVPVAPPGVSAPPPAEDEGERYGETLEPRQSLDEVLESLAVSAGPAFVPVTSGSGSFLAKGSSHRALAETGLAEAGAAPDENADDDDWPVDADSLYTEIGLPVLPSLGPR